MEFRNQDPGNRVLQLLRQLVSRRAQRTELGNRYLYMYAHIYLYVYTHIPVSISLFLFPAMYIH